MLSAVSKILAEGIDGTDGLLRDNAFARRLAVFIVNNGLLPDMIWLLSLLLKNQTPISVPAPCVGVAADRRIRTLFLRNVRQYCLSEATERFYSIDFRLDGRPSSSVVLGANGSGKTSLYASLEYLYLGRSDIAESHGDYDEVSDYFRGVGVAQDMLFEALLEGGMTVKSDTVFGSDIPAMFCSECDYFEISRHWKQKRQYIATQTGYGELLRLLSMLRSVENLIQLTYRYATNQKELKHLSQRKAATSDEIVKKQLQSQIENLKNENKNLNSRFLQEGGEHYVSHISRFVKKIKGVPSSSDNFKQLGALISYLETRWKEVLDILARIFPPIVENVMKDSLDLDYESIDVSSDGEDLDVRLMVKTGTFGAEAKTPVEYFNTFRLKLFCVAFKMALLCCAKIRHLINVPFVVDDIFDSSDFSNRKKIRGFIRRLFESHGKALRSGGESDDFWKNFTLQLLFFTQDNIIGENVYKGISDFIDDAGSGSVRYGRLFRPRDVIRDVAEDKSSDIRKYDLDGEKILTINIEDPLKSYVR